LAMRAKRGLIADLKQYMPPMQKPIKPTRVVPSASAASCRSRRWFVSSSVGTADPYTPPHDVDELRSVGCSVVAYDAAEHAFAHDATRPSYREADARDAFSRAREWLLG
ncbi:MAG: hypothetical protein EBY79_05335, partial [Actinobacteria bacterium]|nr:hypothetical protein [Actinomycetota bacterium]